MKLDLFVQSLWDQLNITNKTKKNYVGAYNRYLKSNIGSSQISDIKKAQLVDILSTLSPQTKYQVLRSVS